jgi:hypothetical protein
MRPDRGKFASSCDAAAMAGHSAVTQRRRCREVEAPVSIEIPSFCGKTMASVMPDCRHTALSFH